MQVTEQLNTALAGRYHIERQIGEGGMATVYLARDIKHGRHVALKVLKQDLGAVVGVERFLSEIQVTASLQHPNLLPLFDSGAVDHLLFYVMPYIEGESLRARLEREKQLPIDDVVRIATAVGAALDYAHKRNVIHRDLKPENILLHEGQPLVADFGIALAVSNAGGNRITQTGLSLGTPQYMSPEQATGDRAIDGRTDIYSLGALTYEMLTGEPPHTGTTSQAIIARLLTEQPRPIRASRPSVPENIEVAVERALEKIPADRWETAKEFGEALTGTRVATRTARTIPVEFIPQDARGVSAATVTVAAYTRPGVRELAAWLVGIVGIALFAFGMFRGSPRAESGVPSEFVIQLPDSLEPRAFGGVATVAISPDGATIVFVASRPGETPRLFRRDLSDRTVAEIRGGDSARATSFSADGSEIVFGFGTNASRRLSLRGGNPRQFVDSMATVSPIAFGDGPFAVLALRNRLFLVPAQGGQRTLLAEPDSSLGHVRFAFPELLPGGEAAVFAISRSTGNDPIESSTIGVVSIPDGVVTDLGIRGSFPKYSATGHLIFATADGLLLAVPFDAARRRATGGSFVVAENVVAGGGGAAAFDVAGNGTLVYRTGSATQERQLVAVSRTGTVRDLGFATGYYAKPRVSPDGRKVALQVGSSSFRVTLVNSPDVWWFDLEAGTRNRITTDSSSRAPVWSSDSEHIVYVYRGPGDSAIVRRSIRSSVPADTLMPHAPFSTVEFGLRGGYVALTVSSLGAPDIWLALMDSLSNPRPLYAEQYAEISPRISPDGKLLAYVTYRSGAPQVYVRNIVSGDEVQVSIDGGGEPVWNTEGQELFYRIVGRVMLSAQITDRPSLSVVRRDTLFADTFLGSSPFRPSYDVFPGGREFLMMLGARAADTTRSEMVVLQSWHLRSSQLSPGDGG